MLSSISRDRHMQEADQNVSHIRWWRVARLSVSRSHSANQLYVANNWQTITTVDFFIPTIKPVLSQSVTRANIQFIHLTFSFRGPPLCKGLRYSPHPDYVLQPSCVRVEILFAHFVSTVFFATTIQFSVPYSPRTSSPVRFDMHCCTAGRSVNPTNNVA